MAQYIERYSDGDKEGMFILASDCLEHGQLITFIELADLKEEIDRLYSDEQSRILNAELMGDYVCDGCTI